jgi:ATP-dependent Clp protease ATP-binding subunit ClpC
MFERFTDRARHSVVAAQDEARSLGHNYIGTEHLLLGLLAEPDGIAGRVLAQLGIAAEGTRADVEQVVGRGDSSPSGHIPFTPRAKKVLELSLREALQLGHNYIGTEHILLGLVREGEGVAAQVLTRRGAALDRVRSLVVAEVKVAAGGREVPAAPRRTPGAEAVIAAAEQLAGSGPVGSHHLLEAMALVDDSLAAGTLAAFGVAPDELAAKIDELGTEGTTDVSPEDSAARRMEVRLGDDELTIVLRDEASVELGRSLTNAVGNPVRGDVPGTPLVGLWRANLLGLQQLLERVDPAEPDQPTRAAAVRAAIRNRLRRRSG